MYILRCTVMLGEGGIALQTVVGYVHVLLVMVSCPCKM